MGRIELSGWIVFLMSGLAFLVSGLRNGDRWVILGSILFVVGILAVLVGASRDS